MRYLVDHGGKATTGMTVACETCRAPFVFDAESHWTECNVHCRPCAAKIQQEWADQKRMNEAAFQRGLEEGERESRAAREEERKEMLEMCIAAQCPDWCGVRKNTPKREEDNGLWWHNGAVICRASESRSAAQLQGRERVEVMGENFYCVHGASLALRCVDCEERIADIATAEDDAYQRGRKEQFAADCAALCERCKDGKPVRMLMPVNGRGVYSWVHSPGNGWQHCNSFPLHEARRLAGGEG